MLVSSSKKNKIILSDYNYRRDVENRILMSQFSLFDVEVLEEILNSSLKFTAQSIAEELEAPLEKTLLSLTTISKTGLISINGNNGLVNKELRKYFEFQILKFDNHFQANMEFLQGLLRKVPIHILPTWYSIPRTSDNIFDSIVEKYLETPKVYQRYLEELGLEDSVLEGIFRDVHNSPDLTVRSRDLREKYQLTREQFEIYLLHLEFNFLCCLSYRQVGDQWKEVVTPFHEWSEYVRFLRSTEHTAIEGQEGIVPFRKAPCAFTKDMEVVLKKVQETQIFVDEDFSTSSESLQSLMLCCEGFGETQEVQEYASYFQMIFRKLCELQLTVIEEGILCATSYTEEWLEMKAIDQAVFLQRHPSHLLFSEDFPAYLVNDRNTRSVEKALERVVHGEWVLFDRFLEGMVVSVGHAAPCTLSKKGRRWAYEIPQYSQDEKRFIKAVVFERLFHIGATEIATFEGNDCFRVTELGKTLLGA